MLASSKKEKPGEEERLKKGSNSSGKEYNVKKEMEGEVKTTTALAVTVVDF